MKILIHYIYLVAGYTAQVVAFRYLWNYNHVLCKVVLLLYFARFWFGAIKHNTITKHPKNNII